jgi:predicted PurR-regulated permease PerM
MKMISVNTHLQRHRQLFTFMLGLLFLFVLLWVLRSVLLPFMVGYILAFLLLPVIRWVERRLPGAGKRPRLEQLKRISIIVIVYLLSLGAVGLVIFYIITVAGKALGTLTQDTSQMIPHGLDTVKQWLKSIPLLSDPLIQDAIDSYMAKAGAALPGLLKDFLTRGMRMFQTSLGMIMGFVSMPIFIFFILKDWCSLRDRYYEALPQWARGHNKNILAILQNVVGRYIIGQLFLGLAVGLCAYALLSVLRIDFALPLAVFAGITEMVPQLGPWLGGGLGILVTLATAPEKVVWVALGYVGIQLFENNLLVPKIQGQQMKIHPALILVLSVIGAHAGGIMGIIMILPLTMAILKIFTYLRNSVRDGSIS